MKSAKLDMCKLVLGSTFAALALASLPAAAVDWNAVASTNSQTVLLDRDSVHAYDGDVHPWVVHGYHQVESLGDMYQHRSKVMLYSFACAKRELGYIQWSMQSGEFGSGQTVWADRDRGEIGKAVGRCGRQRHGADRPARRPVGQRRIASHHVLQRCSHGALPASGRGRNDRANGGGRNGPVR